LRVRAPHLGAVRTDGEVPQAGLIADATGDLFGTTGYGGAYGFLGGTVFELTGTGFQVSSTISLGNGNDTVTGGDGDTITAGNGNDTVYAGANDAISLGNGNDWVYAAASDLITLGNGNDTVAFGVSPSPATIGNATVNGFNPAHDVIDFNVALLANYMAVMGATTQVGLDTVIQVDTNESVTLTNVIASTLSSNNFHFS
jgi:RTX calcium-binding nonapeptide repeat (4 copies)